ncbi:unnamed protein product [Somion occarium]
MTTDTLFNLASVSKAFLSATVGILIDDFATGRNVTPLPASINRFDWNTKVADLLPDDWQLMDEWAHAKANVRDILSHVSGLPRHDYSVKRTDSTLDIIQRMRYLRPAFELRQRWSYNNLMYMLGSHLVSKYSGMPYTEYIKTRIFDPLNMKSTTFSESVASRDGKLTQTWTRFGRRIPFWFSDDMVELNSGPGGVISSVVDMTQWLKALLHAGVNPDTNVTVIPKSAFDEVTTAHAIVSGKASVPYVSLSGYGMGWSRQSYKGHEVISHSGGIPGFSTLVVFLPSDDLGLVVLANADQKDKQTTKIVYRAFEDFLGLERSQPEDAPPRPESSALVTHEISNGELEVYAGTYYNAGYGSGNLTLCAPTSRSSHCQQILHDFSHFTNESSPPSLYAAVPTIWSSHARFRYVGNDTFKLVITYLFPEGYGKDTSPFETYESGEAEGTARFVVSNKETTRTKSVEGFGLFDMVGEVTERQRKGGTIEDTAEVWFERVE